MSSAFISWIVYDGLKRTKDSDEIEGYFLANRSIPWWAAGISVMATQLSAITMIGTTGQGYNDGMRFIQFYYALPVAMIILSVTLVPFFYRSGVYTAYEYLERRFDAKTRSLTSLLFLISRGMSCGAVVSAPAVVLSLVLGWNLTATALADHDAGSRLHDVRRRSGGDLDRRQDHGPDRRRACSPMIVAAILGFPAGVGLRTALGIAAATGRLRAFDFSFDLTNQYTFWSGTDRRAVPLLFVLRHRPEPGAALPDGAIGRRGAALAADERLLEDPAAGPGAPARHPRLRLLRLQPPPLALQQCTPSACRAGLTAQAYAALQTRVRHGVRRAADGSAGTGGGTRGQPTRAAGRQLKTRSAPRESAVQSVRGKAAALVRQTTGDRRSPTSTTSFPPSS